MILLLILLLMCCCSLVSVTGVQSVDGLACDKNPSTSHQTFLWTIRHPKSSKSVKPSYLFGTIHVPYSKVWSHVSDSVKQAFDDSTNVYFELDLADRKTMKSLTRCQLLPAGETIKSHVPSDVYERLVKHMDYLRRALPVWMGMDVMNESKRKAHSDYIFKNIAGNWQRRRPIWLVLMLNSLTSAALQMHGVPVLDLFLAREASRRQKRVGAVEQPSDQCEPLNDLDAKQVVFVLNRTLLKFESEWEKADSEIHQEIGAPQTNKIVHHYNCGTLDAEIFNHESSQLPLLTTATASDTADVARAQAIDAYFRRELIDKRNIRMSDSVKHLLQNGQPDVSYFFAFGAGHFLGENSVIEQLRAFGYEVEPVTDDNQLSVNRQSVSQSVNRQSIVSHSADWSTTDSASYNALALATVNRHQHQDHRNYHTRSNYNDWPTSLAASQLWQRDDTNVGNWRDLESDHYSDGHMETTTTTTYSALARGSGDGVNYNYYYVFHNSSNRIRSGTFIWVVWILSFISTMLRFG